MSSRAVREHGARPDRRRWFILALLVASICINYIDRGNLAVAGRDLSRDLRIPPEGLGLLLSAFFWTYAAFQVVSGWLIDRFGVVWVFAAGFFIWSGATACTGLVSTFTVLFALRLVLGMSESVAYPSYSKIIAACFDEHRRGLVNALVDAGSRTGPAIGVLVGGLILARYGWRVMFLSIGVVSLLWLAPWCLSAGAIHARAPVARPASIPSFGAILSRRAAWGTFLGLFCGNYAWYFLLTWLPQYLLMERHYTTRMMAIYGSLPFWGTAAATLFGGWASDRLIRAGVQPSLVRRTFAGVGVGACTLMLPASLVRSNELSMALLICACLACGLWSSNNWAITQRLAGPVAAGKWTGLQNAFGNLAGVVAPWLTGFLVQRTGSFFLAFVSVTIVAALGALNYALLIGPVDPVIWNTTEQAAEPSM
ncbi:MAG TPA: MFS transporter [Bryobacteraceae bacterium]|nr:MFS transporter [Bryobacteraceae bacterium]